MFYLFLIIAALIGLVTLAKVNLPMMYKIPSGILTLLVICFSLWQTSIVWVGQNETAHLVKKWLGPNLPQGSIIAVNGEKGPQADIIPTGFHIKPLVRVFNEVLILPVVNIPAGYFGEIVAIDGKNLPQSAIIAPPWPGTSLAPGAVKAGIDTLDYLDAKTFLTNGGYKGLQSSVLKPGKHRLNLLLFTIRISNGTNTTEYYDRKGKSVTDRATSATIVTEIPTGFVGVIKSNLNEGWNDEACAKEVEEVAYGQLKATLVPSGCKGVWNVTFEPGAYFFNPAVYEVTKIETRAQRWTYKGGYEKCIINLTVGENGALDQNRKCQDVVFDPEKHADQAIFVKAEGWDIPVELKVLIQITSKQAPAVVAAVGNLHKVEDTIITPSIRSIVRNIGGGYLNAPVPNQLDEEGNFIIKTRPTRALDFAEYRNYLEKAIEEAIIKDGKKAGINILEVKLGEPAIPPELLVARRREQLAGQLAAAYVQEEKSQKKRIQTEAARATANQQAHLVEQKIATERSELFKIQRKNEGDAERDFLMAQAEGEQARANVLGKDRVAMLRIVSMLVENPQVIANLKLPSTMVIGEGAGLSSIAAILGGTQMFGGPKKEEKLEAKASR